MVDSEDAAGLGIYEDHHYKFRKVHPPGGLNQKGKPLRAVDKATTKPAQYNKQNAQLFLQVGTLQKPPKRNNSHVMIQRVPSDQPRKLDLKLQNHSKSNVYFKIEGKKKHKLQEEVKEVRIES